MLFMRGFYFAFWKLIEFLCVLMVSKMMEEVIMTFAGVIVALHFLILKCFTYIQIFPEISEMQNRKEHADDKMTINNVCHHFVIQS